MGRGMVRASCLLLVLSAAFAPAACGEIGNPAAGESPERSAVRLYSDRVRSLHKVQADLSATWQALEKAETQQVFARSLRTRVVPGLRTYISRLSAIRPSLPDLAGVHKGLVDAYTRLERDMQALADKAEKGERGALKEDLTGGLSRARAAEVTYRQDVSAVFAKHGFQVAKASGSEAAAGRAR